MIGSQTDAAAALAGTLPVLSMDGTTRIVYLADGIVYKVNRIVHEDDNIVEYNRAMAISALPDGVYIPDTTLYNVNGKNVIAMEFIEGTAVAECYCDDFGDKHDDTCMPAHVRGKVSGYLDDTSGFNTIVKPNGDIYLIDLA